MLSKNYSLSTLVLLAVFLALLVGTQGTAKQVIVDDADTRILYSSNGWATGTTCPSCFPQLDKSRVRGGTWHFSKYACDFIYLWQRAYDNDLATRPTLVSRSPSLVSSIALLISALKYKLFAHRDIG